MDYHRHIVLVASVCQNALIIGYFFGFSRLLPALVQEYDLSRAQAGLLQSIEMAIFSWLGVVTGLLINRYGSRPIGLIGAIVLAIPVTSCFFTKSLPVLIVACGVIPGIGFSFSYLSAPAAVGQLYQGKARSLALTLVSAGGSVGGTAYAYLLEFLLYHYNLRGTFLICGAIIMNGVWMILIWPRGKRRLTTRTVEVFDISTKAQVPEYNAAITDQTGQQGNCILTSYTSHQNDDDIQQNISTEQHDLPATIKANEFKNIMKNFKIILSDKTFVLFAFGTAFFMISDINLVVYLADIVIDKSGVSSDGSFALFLFSTFGIIGRFFPGVLKQIPKVSVTASPLMSAIISLAAKMLILATGPVFYAMIGVALSGIAYGMQFASLSVTTAKLIGERHLPVGMGVTFTLFGIGSVFIGPLFGHIRDVTGSYIVPFQCSIGFLAVSLVLNCVVFYTRRRNGDEDGE